MISCKCVGLKHFKNDKKDFYVVHYTYEESDTHGVCCDHFSMSPKTFEAAPLHLGDVFIPIRDNRGYLQGVFPVPGGGK